MRFAIYTTSGDEIKSKLISPMLVATPEGMESVSVVDLTTMEDLMRLVDDVGRIILRPVEDNCHYHSTLPEIEVYDSWRE